MAKAVFCMADGDIEAQRIIDELKDAGFSNSDISVLWPNKDNRLGYEHDKSTKAPEGAATGATAGGLIGGTLGWLAGIGLLAIPGIGPFVAAGPIMAALSGAAIGASVGGLTGALVGMGIPEIEAKRYEQGLKEGRVLISVHARDNGEAKRAEELFKNSGAKDVSTGREMSDEELTKKQSKEMDKSLDRESTDVIPPPIDSSEQFPRGV